MPTRFYQSAFNPPFTPAGIVTATPPGGWDVVAPHRPPAGRLRQQSANDQPFAGSSPAVAGWEALYRPATFTSRRQQPATETVLFPVPAAPLPAFVGGWEATTGQRGGRQRQQPFADVTPSPPIPIPSQIPQGWEVAGWWQPGAVRRSQPAVVSPLYPVPVPVIVPVPSGWEGVAGQAVPRRSASQPAYHGLLLFPPPPPPPFVPAGPLCATITTTPELVAVVAAMTEFSATVAAVPFFTCTITVEYCCEGETVATENLFVGNTHRVTITGLEDADGTPVVAATALWSLLTSCGDPLTPPASGTLTGDGTGNYVGDIAPADFASVRVGRTVNLVVTADDGTSQGNWRQKRLVAYRDF